MSRGNPRIDFRLPRELYAELEKRAGDLSANLYARSIVLTALGDGSPANGADPPAEARTAAAPTSKGPASSQAPGPNLGLWLSNRARIPLAVANREVRAGKVKLRDDGKLEYEGRVL